MRSHSLVPLLTFVFSLVAVVADAQWQPAGVPLCTAANDQISPVMIPDGAGGAILTWFDFRADGVTGDIYAQRVNSLGVPQWTANGVGICTVLSDQAAPVIVPDGGTGAIIAWYDSRNGNTDVYAQRVNASGVPQWTANGVALSLAVNAQIYCDIAPDGAGGAIVVWEDHRPSGAVGDIYAQRVNASGVPQWTANGVAVCTAGSDQLNPRIVTDGAGGAVIVWQDYRSLAEIDIYAQRINATGVPQWAANGIAVCAVSGNQYFPRLISDGSNGAIVAWQDDRNAGISDIYAQRLNGAGASQWTPNGVAACAAIDFQMNPSLVSDGAGGAILVWDDQRKGSETDVYAQRVGAAGTIQWQTDGVAIVAVSAFQDNALITSDGAGGAVIAWRDTRIAFSTEVYAQRVNPFGVVQWTVDGVQLTVPPAQPSMGSIVWDGSGAAIIAMFDYRSGPGDIYAQRVDGHFGYWGHPEPVITSVADIPKDQGGYVAVNWTASQRDVNNPRTIGHYSVWRAVTSLPLNASAMVLQDIASVTPGTKGPVYAKASSATDYYWELVGTQTAHGFGGYSFAAPTRADSVAGNTATERFMVAAHDQYDDYLAFQSNTGTGHSVDNLAPAAPLLLTIGQSGTSALLSWKAVDAPDLAHYKVYRTPGSGTTPVSGNFLVDEALTNHLDFGTAAAGYHYIVTAVDSHGNQSGPSNEVSLTGSTGIGGDAPPLAVVVDGNAPNPFRGTSAFRVGLPRDGDVRVAIYDVGGRRVRDARVSGVKGWQTLALDGRDNAGHELASGVYFYRVTTEGTTITRKMVIAR